MRNLQSAATGRTDLFTLGQDRLNWLASRQRVLASNIANADTPDYTPKDVSPFEASLNAAGTTLTATQPGHFTLSESGAGQTTQTVSEQSLDGNAVSLEQQMVQVAKVSDEQHFAVNVYSKYLSMFQTVLGK